LRCANHSGWDATSFCYLRNSKANRLVATKPDSTTSAKSNAISEPSFNLFSAGPQPFEMVPLAGDRCVYNIQLDLAVSCQMKKAPVRSGGDQDSPGLLSSQAPRNKTNSLHAIAATI
jgi:hypothetical protein